MAGTALVGLLLAASAAAAADDRIVINPRSPYPEGPVAVGADVYYAEMGSDRVMHWNGLANLPVWERAGCGPTSVARAAGGALVVLCHREEAVALITTAGATLAVTSIDSEGRHFHTPNASINDAKGGVYFSSSGTFSPTSPAEGAVLYLDKSGGMHRVAEGIHYSNGVALSPDGTVLYVSEHLSRRILAYDVAADGSLSNTRVFLRLDDVVGVNPKREWDVGPDGLAMDSHGNLYIAEYGAAHLVIVDKAGKLITTIDFPQQYVTAPALIDGEKRIFVTAPASFEDPKADGEVWSVANPAYGRN